MNEKLAELITSYGKFLITSSIVGCISLLILFAFRHCLEKYDTQPSHIVIIANSSAYFCGTLMSYILQIRFVHQKASFSKRGLIAFFPGQLLISLSLGITSAKLESMLAHGPGNEITLALAALALALFLTAPVSFLYGRYCTTIL